MRRIFKLKAMMPIFVLGLCIAILLNGTAHAFTSNDLMDDPIFDNSNAWSASQIDSWLNTNFPQGCISSVGGFTAPDPTGYSPSGGFTYGANVTAGQVISDAARAYDINPQVLLTTMQKEQSLVTGNGSCSVLAYTGAMGYGCPDGGTSYSYSGVDLFSIHGNEFTSVSGTCVNSASKVGFSEQVIHAAWLLKFGEERSEGNVNWDVQSTNYPQTGDVWNNSDDPQSCYSGPMTQGDWQVCPGGATAYSDGYTTIDGTSTYMGTGATAALYWYTPHFSGNENFDTIFTNWFGNVYSSVAQYAGQTAYPSLQDGQSTSSYILYKNTGNVNWYDDTDAAANGQQPVHLAVTNPINSTSPFSYGWPNYGRPATTFAAVYDSDGVTLAPNQHVVTPGEIVKFAFNITAPYGLSPGNYTLYVQPVLENAPDWQMGGFAWFNVTVIPSVYSATYAGQSAYPTLADGQSTSSYILYKNTGNVNWYDDTDAAANGQQPVHLAATNPINRSSLFSYGWPNNGRPATTFGAVYDSDGVTLAPDQHTVTPGEIAKFNFNLTAIWSLPSGTYTEYFQPIVEGSSNWNMGGLAWTNITIPSTSNTAQYAGQTAYPSLQDGQSTSSYILYKNTGNVNWYDDTDAAANGQQPVHLAVTNPINSTSPFSYGWPNYGRPATTFAAVYDSDGVTLAPNQHVVTPGEIVKFAFNITAPYGLSPGNYTLYVQPITEGVGNWNLGGVGWFDVTVH